MDFETYKKTEVDLKTYKKFNGKSPSNQRSHGITLSYHGRAYFNNKFKDLINCHREGVYKSLDVLYSEKEFSLLFLFRNDEHGCFKIDRWKYVSISVRVLFEELGMDYRHLSGRYKVEKIEHEHEVYFRVVLKDWTKKDKEEVK